mmetsp:Transcript_90511/g.141287  ORF Transcript_90511/g.141287 Transcript_90511/m.141287 type:complete len:86 (+) Transcript_90511:65-322(+)
MTNTEKDTNTDTETHTDTDTDTDTDTGTDTDTRAPRTDADKRMLKRTQKIRYQVRVNQKASWKIPMRMHKTTISPQELRCIPLGK